MSERDPQTPTPEEDAALAHDLFLQGDLQHGSFHLACALASDPLNEDWLALADRYVEAADDPLALAPLGGDEKGSYFATAALRSYVLRKLGRTGEALNLLLQVNAATPEMPFLAWTIAWLEHDPAAGALIDRGHLTRFLGGIVSAHPGDHIDDPAICEALRPVLRLTELTVGDPDPDERLTFTRAALLRKTGHLDEALSLARRAYEATPCYHLASSVAQVYHARNEEEPWREWQETALRHEPGDIPTRNDLGDHYFARGNLAEAERWYREILDLDPGEPWARPSSLAVRAHQGDKNAENELRAYAADHPDNERASQLGPFGTPYVDDFPSPQEAIVNILRQLRAKVESGETFPPGEVKINVSGLEAPSARLALETGLADLGLHLTVRYSCKVQSPDPRLPRRRVRFQVWQYPVSREWLIRKNVSTDPVPAVPRPPEALAQAIGELAQTPYNRRRWLDGARPIVSRLHPTVENVLGVLAFPPPTPQDRQAPDWIYQIDIAAALVLATIDETPWIGSVRRTALLDLAMGPMDWSVDAAVVALATLAESDPDIVPEVAATLDILLKNQPGPGYVCYEAAVVYCSQLLMGLPESLRALVAEHRRALESQD
jgi:tetratricopeptide (TPR) repeat protein